MTVEDQGCELLARLISEAILDHDHQMATVSAQLDIMAERINFLEHRLADYEGVSFLAMVETPHSC